MTQPQPQQSSEPGGEWAFKAWVLVKADSEAEAEQKLARLGISEDRPLGFLGDHDDIEVYADASPPEQIWTAASSEEPT